MVLPPVTASMTATSERPWLLTELLFARSGYLLSLREDDRLDDVVVDVVNGTMTQGDLERWFRDRMTRETRPA